MYGGPLPQGLFEPATARNAVQYAQVNALLSGRTFQRSICLTGVAQMTITKRIKKAALPSPLLPPRRSAQAQRKRGEALELDASHYYEYRSG